MTLLNQEVSRLSILAACEQYGTGLTEANIADAAKLFEVEGVKYQDDQTNRVLSIEKRPHMSAEIIHIRPIAAAMALASFVEGVVAFETHPAFTWLAVLHMVESLMGIRQTYSRADGDLLYLVYRGMQTQDTHSSLRKQEFGELWPNVDFDTTLARFVESGLVEQSGESLLLREKVLLRTPPAILE